MPAKERGPRLLERERELAELREALDGAITGEGGVVVVEGAAGIGKSELLRASAETARARGALTLTARGTEVEHDLPFGALRQLLEPLLRETDEHELRRLFAGAAMPARRLFGTDADHIGDEQATPEFATLNAVYWLLAGLADDQPLALIVDDAHWVDSPSLRLLDFLVPRLGELSTSAIIATRPPSEDDADAVLGRLLGDPAIRVIRPGPLSVAAVRDLVSDILGEEPAQAFVEACAELTGGNPFYLAELLRELQLRGAGSTADDAVALRSIAPRNISFALLFRGASADDAMALARAIAVLGDGVRLADAAAVAGLRRASAAGAADALVHDAVLAPGPELVFAHPIVRAAVYAEVGPHERARAHARAARLLDGVGAPIERVAAHLMRSEPASDPWAVESLRAAAKAALAEGAPDSAVRYLRRALAEPPDQAVCAQVLLELGRAEASIAQPDAISHLSEAFALATDARGRADVAMAAAFPLASVGRVHEAVTMLAEAADELAGQGSDTALEVEGELSAFAMVDPAAAALHGSRLDRMDEDLAGDSPGARLLLCHLAYRRMWRSLDAARAAELAERALAHGKLLAERGSEATELNSAAVTLIGADRLTVAAQLLDAALAQSRERGSRPGFAHVSFLRSLLAYRRGALRDVEAEAEAALATFPQEQIVGVAVSTAMLIAALLERGAVDEADDCLTAAGMADGQLPSPAPVNLLLSVRGRLRLAQGDVASGLSDLRECGRRSQPLELRNPIVLPWRVDAALAYHGLGELDAARALADEELAAAYDWGTPAGIGTAQRLMGLLTSGDEAIALLQDAEAALADSPARLEHARALIDLGAALRRANRRGEARQPLSRGLDLADRCGATVLSERARHELRSLGARPRRARLTGLDALTPSERRVAELAANGLANTDIAQTLFVTRKTIEKHLSNAYAKLGVKSRDELPAQFSQLTGPER